MNDSDLCLEVVSRSSQPLCYIPRWISRIVLGTGTWVLGYLIRYPLLGTRSVPWYQNTDRVFLLPVCCALKYNRALMAVNLVQSATYLT